MIQGSSKNELEEVLIPQLQFSKRGGLLPVIVQEFDSGQVLMLGYANEEAFQKTLKVRKATFWSTSRKKLWTKGETSGNYLLIKNIMVDCDQDAIIYQVELMGDGVCHTFNQKGKNRKACFYRNYTIEKNELEFIEGME
ncbi:phosphoribosyl-AMP cyclohydrolase [Flammeovirga pectinis]|uniref:Histidine biosynthesis bifunctional protein HisIE n=1 Tax=Flammeovirga pectinis TaxID=2494373 RepID=A0A3Q9FS69_9BACT|nr:phosphoribosyl-AMP cyclohydrolase [Flammeovirga pectinis]AZQ63301.1 phosphoribosyl-AMP cyclohydrolase [Flammeovirga pectinis]